VIRLVYVDTGELIDGIRTYVEQCRDALQALKGESADIELWAGRQTDRAKYDGDVVVVNYNPFSYARWGFAPWLIRRLRTLRRHGNARSILLFVHEAFVPPRSVRWALMGAWQRAQLAALGRSCDGIVISSEAWRQPVRHLIPRAPIYHVPVGSNLPDQRARRAEVRAAYGWGEDILVVGALGADPASRLPELGRAALNGLAQVRSGTVLSDLGTASVVDDGLSPEVEHHRPGFQSSIDLAIELAAVDVFLAPFEDGVSARRTTLVAALQHELAIVGTLGRNTDSYLANDSRLTLVDVESHELFVESLVEVATDDTRRAELRRASRELFDERFSWETLATRLVGAIDDVA
jgi:glycosyltransferase involved in cell wall biosynthesis